MVRQADHDGMTLRAVPDADVPSGRWLWEAARGNTRAVRVSAHARTGLVALSLWREDRCVGSLRLAPAEVSSLVAKLTAALAELTVGADGSGPDIVPDLGAQLEAFEARLAALEDPAG